MLLKDGSPRRITGEVGRICEFGIMKGGKFILREGNNLALCAPIECIEAAREAGKKYVRSLEKIQGRNRANVMLGKERHHVYSVLA